MKKWITQIFVTVTLTCLISILLSSCGQTSDAPSLEQTETSDITTENVITPDESPKHEYLSGYEDLLVYQEIKKIEQCTSPESLCDILSEIYEDEITYIELDYETVKNEYIIQVLQLYNVDLMKAPLVSRIYVFLRPYHETPVFIMDDDGSYPVSSFEIKSAEDGNSYSKLIAWQATDLFLCLHSYAKCEDNIEDREFLSDAVRAMKWYMDYESRVILNIYAMNSTYDVFSQIASEDSRVEWLYPIMDGTLSSRIGDFIRQAENITAGDGPIYDYESLYPYQDEIRDVTDEVTLVAGNNGLNDRLLLNYFNDVGRIDMYIEEFITFASQGFNDYRIEEYTTFCYELSSPLKATEIFLQME